jgi:hypothetical protein
MLMAGVKWFLLKAEIHLIREDIMFTNTCFMTINFLFDTYATHTPALSTLPLLKVKNKL